MDTILDILAAVGVLVIVLCLGLLAFKAYLMSRKIDPPRPGQKTAGKDDDGPRHASEN